MNPPVETVRISEWAKNRLIYLRGRTGVGHWNILCRVALCRSLAATSFPPPVKNREMSNVEIAWETFGGHDADIYAALVIKRAQKDGIDVTDRASVGEYFRSHLERGIELIRARNVRDLVKLSAGSGLEPFEHEIEEDDATGEIAA